MAVANLHREFCTALEMNQALSLVAGDLVDVDRRQGNE
jgi:hypothetical protein